MVVGRRTGDLILNRFKVDHLSFVRPPIIITIVLLFHSYCRICGGEEKDYDYIDALYRTAINMHKAISQTIRFQTIPIYMYVL